MNTRPMPSVFIAAVVSALVLAPWRGASLPPTPDLDPIPVQGRLSPDGRFDGTLVVKTVTVADAGRLILTGVLDGTVIRRNGAHTPVRGQPFTAPAVPVEAARTTDVVLLKMPPIALAAVGRPLTLAPVPLDIEAVPDEGLLFPTPPPEGVGHGRDSRPMSELITSHSDKILSILNLPALAMDSSHLSGMRRGVMGTRPVSLRPALDRPALPVRPHRSRSLEADGL